MSEIILAHDVSLALKQVCEGIYCRFDYNMQRCNDLDNLAFIYEATTTTIRSYAKVISSLGLDRDIRYGVLKVTQARVDDLYNKARQLAVMNEDVL
jgi:hypothetical protein